MQRAFRIAGNAAAAAMRFAVAYPWTCVVAAAIYAGYAAVAARYLVLPQPPGFAGPHLVSWLMSLPQTVLLGPLWTALPRFVILGERNRRTLTFDYRLRRVLFVTIVLSAMWMADRLALALALDALEWLPAGVLVTKAMLLLMFGVTVAGWWILLRLAIAPALAAASARRYAFDTAFAFTRGWVGTIAGVKVIVYAPLVVLIFWLRVAGGAPPGVQASLVEMPLSIAVVTLVSALAQVVDAAAMALVTMQIVKARRGEGESQDVVRR